MGAERDGTQRSVSDEATGSLGELPGIGGLGPGFEGGATVVPVVPPAAGHASSEPPEISRGTTFLYSSGNFGSGIFYAFNNFILPLFLSSLGMADILIGLLASTRSFEGAFIQPLVGERSDHTWNRLGRRRPFIVAFVPMSALFLLLSPLALQAGPLGHLVGWSPAFTVLALLTVGIFLFTLTFNVMYDPFNALLADITPERQRGRVNGVFQAFGAFGQVSILLVAFLLNVDRVALFLLTGAALLVFFIPTVLGIREPRRLYGAGQRQHYTWRDYWRGLRGDRQILLYFTVQFFLWFGINAITPYLTLFATKEAGFSDTEAVLLSLVLLLSTALSVWPFGVLSDRIGLKRVFLIGMLLMAGGAVAGILTRDHVLLFLILGVAGFGNGAQTASSYPVLTRIVFPEQMGLYTGLNSSITSIAAPASVLLAGAIVSFTPFGYNALFPFIAVMFLLSLIPLALLQMDQSLYARARAARQASS